MTETSVDVKTLPSKISRRLVRRVMNALGRDNITYEKIATRSDLLTIGSTYGGWVVPTEELGTDSVCYCVGCGEDITFDLGLVERFGCEVFGFDPTPRAIAHVEVAAKHQPKYHFEPVGVWDKEDVLRFYAPRNPAHVSHSLVNLQKTAEFIEIPVKPLRTLMSSRAHDHLDLLKLDVEGAEYRVIEAMLADSIRPHVLCVEFDEWFNPLDSDWRSRIAQAIDSLKKQRYQIVHARGDGNYTFVLSR